MRKENLKSLEHTSFENIVGNLKQIMLGNNHVREKAKSALIVYLQLIINYEDFRKSELLSSEGYFPELTGSILERPYLIRDRLANSLNR